MDADMLASDRLAGLCWYFPCYLVIMQCLRRRPDDGEEGYEL